MNRRSVYAASALALTAVLASTVVRCEVPATAFTSFSYSPRERPRVFVSHHPLRALPGQTVTIRLAPDLRAEDGAVQQAKAGLRPLNGTVRDEQICPAQTDGTFACEFPLRSEDDDHVYDGHLLLANGTRVNARAAYRFRAAAAIGADEALPLREPVIPIPERAETSRVDTVFVHDAGDAYTFDAFLDDLETSVFEGILTDPVYRWRDDQLGFYVYGTAGFTSSYYSGLDTRCGQNPWPADLNFRNGFSRMEVLGVLHRHPTSASGVEGTVVAEPDLRDVFRDCAGIAIKNANLRTFSTRGGQPETARVAKHEYGHAAFGLGDEYLESTETRTAQEAPVNPFDTSCCCVSDSGAGGGTVPGTIPVPGAATGRDASRPTTGGAAAPGAKAQLGVRTVQCVAPGGGTRGGVGENLPACTGTFPPHCGASPQGGCGPLESDCVVERMWLGQGAPASGMARLNIYPSESDCEAARTRAAAHPGVEDRERSLATECRQLCGPGVAPCPCDPGLPGQEPQERWIVDTNPAGTQTPPATEDSMADVSADRHGGTCAWCVETSLCVRWQRALGNSVDSAHSYCDAPPLNAAEAERQSVTLAAAILAWVRELTKNWRF